MTRTRSFISYAVRVIVGKSAPYRLWMISMLALLSWGLAGYIHQLEHGLIVTNMRDPVMWGFYIGNFNFLVGVAAAAVVLVIPAYIYKWKPIAEIAVIGELLAVAALIMCMAFIIVDIGRPDRLWHVIPLLGKLAFPQSILAWDVVVLSSYLLINGVVIVHLVYRAARGRAPNKKLVVPLVLLSIPMAVGIHTVTAFLYSGIGARPYWNTAILAPRFLASAFCSGPAIILIVLQILRRWYGLNVKDEAIWKIGELIAYAIMINLFLFGAEVFTVAYAGTHEAAHLAYLFGFDGLGAYTLGSLVLSLLALAVFATPAGRKNVIALNVACVAIYIAVYIEKGIALVIPGLTPSAMGQVYHYRPSLAEVQVAAGIYALGCLLFTLMLRVAIPLLLKGLIRPSAEQRFS